MVTSIQMSPIKKELRLFKSTLLSSNYVFSDGTVAKFVNGKYATDNPKYIGELEQEISRRHPYLYIDPNNVTIDYDHTDPMAELRKKFYKEFLESETAKLADFGNLNTGASVQGPLKATNSQDIAAITLGSAKK